MTGCFADLPQTVADFIRNLKGQSQGFKSQLLISFYLRGQSHGFTKDSLRGLPETVANFFIFNGTVSPICQVIVDFFIQGQSCEFTRQLLISLHLMRQSLKRF